MSKMKDLIGDIVSSFSENEVGNSEVQNKAIYSGLTQKKKQEKGGQSKNSLKKRSKKRTQYYRRL